MPASKKSDDFEELCNEIYVLTSVQYITLFLLLPTIKFRKAAYIINPSFHFILAWVIGYPQSAISLHRYKRYITLIPQALVHCLSMSLIQNYVRDMTKWPHNRGTLSRDFVWATIGEFLNGHISAKNKDIKL